MTSKSQWVETFAFETRLVDTTRGLAPAIVLRVGRMDEQIADLRSQFVELQRQVTRLRVEAEPPLPPLR